ADLSAVIDGRPIPMDECVNVLAGSVLSFKQRKSGLRAYLAASGGYTLPRVMGSRSTNVRAGFGGLGGLPLRKGYFIGLRAPRLHGGGSVVRIPAYPADVVREPAAPIRVLPGRQWGYFSEESQAAL